MRFLVVLVVLGGCATSARLLSSLDRSEVRGCRDLGAVQGESTQGEAGAQRNMADRAAAMGATHAVVERSAGTVWVPGRSMVLAGHAYDCREVRR